MTTNGTRRPPLRSCSVVCDRRPARASQVSAAAAAAAAGSSAGLDSSPHIRVDRSLSSPALGATTRRSSRRDVCDAANNRLFGTNHCHGEPDTEYRRALVFASKPEPTPTVAFADNNFVCPSSGNGSRPSRPSLKAPSSQGQGQRKTEIAKNYNGNGPNTRPSPSSKWNELTTAVAAVMPTTKIITPDVKRSPSADDAAHLLQHPHHHQQQQGGWQSISASLPYIPYADDSDASGNSH